MILQQLLARLFNRHWLDWSTVAGTILQQSLARLLNSGWHDSSTVAGTIVQQSLARLINSGWHDFSTVTGTIFQQPLARFFNSHWQDYSTVTGRFFLFSMLAEFFSSEDHCWRIVPCTRNTAHDPNLLWSILMKKKISSYQYYVLALVMSQWLTFFSYCHQRCI